MVTDFIYSKLGYLNLPGIRDTISALALHDFRTKEVETVMLQQRGLGPVPDLQTIRDMGWANTIWIVGVLIVILLIKVIIQKELMGVAAYGPTERGFRERRGKPSKYLVMGLWAYMIGLGKHRRTTIAKEWIPTNAEGSTQAEEVYIIEAKVQAQVLDTKEDVYSAIYRTADEQQGKGDTHNAERQQTIEEACGYALLRIIQETKSGAPVVTLEKILSCSIAAPRQDKDLVEAGYVRSEITVEEYIKAICGSAVLYVMPRVIRHVDSQMHKDGLMRRSDSDVESAEQGEEESSQPDLTVVGS